MSYSDSKKKPPLVPNSYKKNVWLSYIYFTKTSIHIYIHNYTYILHTIIRSKMI